MQPRAASFQQLVEKVQRQTEGRLALVQTDAKGRCLQAAKALPAGSRIRDCPVLEHGTDLGSHLVKAVTVPDKPQSAGEASSNGLSSCSARGVDGAELAGAPTSFPSVDLLVGLDFLASLVLFLSRQADGMANENGDDALLWALYSFPADDAAETVPMVRKWHKRWNAELSARVPVELVEAAWQHVVPNWRRLVATPLKAAWLRQQGGEFLPSVGHELVCGLWLLMALCEHSCDPNCALAHDGGHLWFHMLRDVAVGEALSTSYLNFGDLCLPLRLRRKRLHENWGFHCSCARCLLEESQGVGRPKAPAASSELKHGNGSTSGYVVDPNAAANEPAMKGPGRSARKFPGWGDIQKLHERLRHPPTEQQGERVAYCEAVYDLIAVARQILGADDPTVQALLQRASIFSPDDGVEAACVEHLSVCMQLYGDTSAVVASARLLLEAPQDYLEQFLKVLVTCRSDDGCFGAETQSVSGDARQTLRAMYRRYLESRAEGRSLEMQLDGIYVGTVGQK